MKTLGKLIIAKLLICKLVEPIYTEDVMCDLLQMHAIANSTIIEGRAHIHI